METNLKVFLNPFGYPKKNWLNKILSYFYRFYSEPTDNNNVLMKMTRFYFILTFCFFTTLLFGQKQDELISTVNSESANDLNIDVVTDTIEALSSFATLNTIDTIKIDTTLIEGKVVALIDHSEATEFDKKWLESWRNNVIDSSLIIKPEDTVGKVVIENFSTEQLKERIAYLDSQTPFNFEYNPSLEKIIKHYLKNRQQTLANLMGKAKYYFPMFEEHLAKYNIPMELKYLAIVESALKANATSRVGAKGLWQFMYGTGREYDLKVSSYVDERCDPIKATEAACQYLTKLHGIFNDWDLALAAYNSGPGNVNKAIRRSGGQKNYWNYTPLFT
ncbi:lytic transglycosylase domain-containing protein [Lutimonas zeaxanthinifaciens]|uniref:lytic transglycosylase domain-containing protein n=1 Tax=Lutimonas zeaxanthinifaciens TaxID=3060215 RepID=UPI003204A7F5